MHDAAPNFLHYFVSYYFLPFGVACFATSD
jgi:hypothetical protein